jgi:AAHS family 4-hydroxybenzoate transporter-like MFS transporter
LLLKLVPNDQTNLLVFGLGLHGLFVNAVNCTLYAASAFLYPTYIRATGTATALAVGRFGAILSSFTGAALIAYSGASAFLTFLGLAMIVVASALVALRTHIPASQRSTLKVSTAPAR